MRRFLLFLILLLAAPVSSSFAQQQPVYARGPVYPLTAQAAGIQGDVTIKAILTIGGTVRDVQAIAGPQELRQAAVNAVNQWRYHPYLKHGKPVEVDLTVTVRFKLGNKKQKAAAMAKARAELAAHPTAPGAAPQRASVASPPNQQP